jgi:hypothetical protein
MRTTRRGSSERGTIILVCLIAVFIIAGISAALMGQVQSNQRQVQREVQAYRAFEVAEAGLAEQMAAIFVGNGPTSTGTSTVGPITFNGGSYTATLDAVWGANADRITVTCSGTYQGVTETVSGEFARGAAEIAEPFLKAIYAGNDSEVPAGTTTFPSNPSLTYNMNFGGGVDALDNSGGTWDGDHVSGDVYAAGNITRTNEAQLNGEVKGPGSMTMNGQGQSQHTAVNSNQYVKPPDLVGQNYDQIADVKITPSTFGGSPTSGQKSISNTSNPAHIFTMNRSDMGTENGLTPKADFYLEDMPDGGGSYNNPITPGITDKIIYIDGNVWVHNKNVIEFEWAKDTRLTIVVKGNIYISDDIVYNGAANGTPGDSNSMIAWIALKDSNLSNPAHSGNIIMGDPAFGTVDFMSGIFYAERDFKDQNLSSAGAATFEIYGGMLAGNRVSINRDYSVATSHWEDLPTRGMTWVPKGNYHSEMNVQFDNRLLDPNFKKPPGLPAPESGSPAGSWSLIGWRRGA